MPGYRAAISVIRATVSARRGLSGCSITIMTQFYHRWPNSCGHGSRASAYHRRSAQGGTHVKPMKEYAAKPLAWIQPAALKHIYQLRSGDEVAGTLEWQEGLTGAAVAKSADGAWTV